MFILSILLIPESFAARNGSELCSDIRILRRMIPQWLIRLCLPKPDTENEITLKTCLEDNEG